MKVYNTKDWVESIFKQFKSETFHRLKWMLLAVSGYTFVCVYVIINYVKPEPNSLLKNFTILHTLLSFAISILLVFRTNTAYDRWWEGRKIWGSLVNNSRNLALKIKAIYKVSNKRTRFFAKVIPLYSKVLRIHLQEESTRLVFDEEFHEEFELNVKKHLPNQVALRMFLTLQDMYDDKEINGEQLLYLNEEVKSFTDACGACERIKNTPIPYSYASFIKKIIFIYVATLPFSLSLNLHYLAIPVVVFVFYVMAGLELVAEEIEDPFGTDANDLPMEKISNNIQKHVHEILD